MPDINYIGWTRNVVLDHDGTSLGDAMRVEVVARRIVATMINGEVVRGALVRIEHRDPEPAEEAKGITDVREVTIDQRSPVDLIAVIG